MRLNLFSNNNSFEEFDEQFILFIKGKMSPDEENRFKVKIKSDPVFKERAKVLAYLIKNIKTVGEERDKTIIAGFSQFSSEKELREFISSMKQSEQNEERIRENDVSSKRQLRKSIIRWSSIAAILIIGFFLGNQYYESYRVTTLADKYCIEYDMSSNLRGSKDVSTENELVTLIGNIKNGKELKQSLSNLERIYGKAVSEEYNEYTDYSATIAWYLALAYLKDNRKEDAVIVLDKLIKDNPDSAISKMAEKLKNEIINL